MKIAAPCKCSERASAVRFLRHWAKLSGAFEDVAGRNLLNQFAKRLEDGEHLWPLGVTGTRDPSRDNQEARVAALEAENAQLRDDLAKERATHAATRSAYDRLADNPIFED